MSELFLQEFQQLIAVQPADLLNVQRQQSGIWSNYKAAVSAITGVETLIYQEDHAVNDVVNLMLLPALTNQVYLILHSWIRYNPGVSPVGQLGRVQVSWTDPNFYLGTVLKFMGNMNGAPLGWDSNTGTDPGLSALVANIYDIAVNTPIGPDDGTVTFFIEYAIVDV